MGPTPIAASLTTQHQTTGLQKATPIRVMGITQEAPGGMVIPMTALHLTSAPQGTTLAAMTMKVLTISLTSTTSQSGCL